MKRFHFNSLKLIVARIRKQCMIFSINFIFLHDWKYEMIIPFVFVFIINFRLKFTFQIPKYAICRLPDVERRNLLSFHTFASEHLKTGRTSKFWLTGLDLNFSLFDSFTFRYIGVYITFLFSRITLKLHISNSFLGGFYSLSVLT